MRLSIKGRETIILFFAAAFLAALSAFAIFSATTARTAFAEGEFSPDADFTYNAEKESEYIGVTFDYKITSEEETVFKLCILDAPETAAYTSVSFDYQITFNSGTMALGVFNSANNGGFGYYDFGASGISATGITCNTLEDGWIHVVIDLTQTTKIFNSNQVSEFTRVYVRGKNCTADGYIDNIQWTI